MYKFSLWFMGLWSVFCLLGYIIAMSHGADVQTSGMYEETGKQLGLTIASNMWLDYWFKPMVVAALIAMLSKSNQPSDEKENKPKIKNDDDIMQTKITAWGCFAAILFIVIFMTILSKLN